VQGTVPGMLSAQIDAIKRRLHQVADDQQDAVAMQALAPLQGAFLPWTPYSMRPSVIVAVLSDIVINRRDLIVECGSGNSTVYTARLLERRGSGRIVSLDDDSDWAGRTRELLAAEGLSDRAEVVHVPLRAGWYDPAAIPELSGIGLLVVDGPPANAPDTAQNRAGAVAYFESRLAPDATVILDDMRRGGEAAVLEMWRRHRRFRLERGGYAISGPHV
jgi:predicted O-methyltransferase YrrM